ncbi:UDP-glycosyltransferase 74E2-like [Benincasa hispida]|uniref:UDP-glycosyltransferase 74E2-like n=1 Tax=Benincasa hispida TaxID=102211 RepID=UPI00190214F0|nr:UDP-glycosyltransferase 74E2-like [Benincasa hispida]XP_038888326.1 UDP-glycosyltransferase 74E2-like [Benincasa hispida]XP_038888327.1 UDP-glycosyltransferase 74E2-like [Benincasa hispida]
MERVRKEGKVHILVIPFPDAQGHINPILQFSKRLAFKGLKVTLLNVLHESNPTYELNVGGGDGCSNFIINVEERPRAPYNGREPESIESYMHRLKTSICFHLTSLVTQQQSSNSPFVYVVYDSLMPWILDVATAFGLRGAPFFTQSSAVNAIFYHINHGSFKLPVAETGVLLPGLPLLHASDLPSLLIPNPQHNPFFLKLMIDQLHDLPDWMFINSFHALETQAIEWMQRHIPLKTVGPTIPSIMIDKELKIDDHNYRMNLTKSTENDNSKIMEWLDSKVHNSVIYVSLGTTSNLREEQMEELAWGLKATNKTFLWVIKEAETPNKLPHNFVEELKGMGMVVKWCSQVHVLAHKSIGCFVTHCGWNSVLEAIACGVPMVSMPQWTDQMTNAKFVEDVWKIGVRVNPKQNGIVRRQEIELCIRKVMEGKKSLEIRQNATKWMKLTAQDQTSDDNIDDFVTQLTNRVV